MKVSGLLILFIASSFGAPLAASAATSDGCDLGKVQTIGELQAILSIRAVDAVRLAAAPSATTDRRLAQLVSSSAQFSSGGGDVGLPMGTGVDGLRALAKHMNAASFHYYGWDGIPTPVQDVCGVQKVEVEFIDATSRNAFPVTFTFEAGRIVAAAGWRRSLETGQIDRSRD
jgi:hypothetical protein